MCRGGFVADYSLAFVLTFPHPCNPCSSPTQSPRQLFLLSGDARGGFARLLHPGPYGGFSSGGFEHYRALSAGYSHVRIQHEIQLFLLTPRQIHRSKVTRYPFDTICLSRSSLLTLTILNLEFFIRRGFLVPFLECCDDLFP